MPTAPYILADGSRVPGTTTIIGRFKDAGGLIYWAWEQGKEGKDYRETANKAADIGTAAHAMVEARINFESTTEALNKYLPDENRDDFCKKAKQAFTAYLEWESQSKIKIISKYQEQQFVSEKYRYGGTPDAIGEIDGKLYLLDWKTSNRTYSDYLIQLAAYRNLWEENNPDKPLSGFHICRFAKDYPDFEHRYFGELGEAWEQFKLFRQAYDIDKSLRKRV